MFKDSFRSSISSSWDKDLLLHLNPYKTLKNEHRKHFRSDKSNLNSYHLVKFKITSDHSVSNCLISNLITMSPKLPNSGHPAICKTIQVTQNLVTLYKLLCQQIVQSHRVNKLIIMGEELISWTSQFPAQLRPGPLFAMHLLKRVNNLQHRNSMFINTSHRFQRHSNPRLYDCEANALLSKLLYFCSSHSLYGYFSTLKLI